MGFSFIFALYEGSSGNPASKEDCSTYASQIGAQSFPVLADGSNVLTQITPMALHAHPTMCALSPDLRIISCYAGHGGYESALDDIRNHAGL